MAYRKYGLPLALLLALGATTGVAAAKPLDADTCQRIKGEIQALEQQGIRDLIAKGPQTAKTLDATKLDKIRSLLDLDGQSRFRCGDRAFVTLKEEPPEDPQEAGTAPATIDNSTPGITLPPGAQSVGPIVPPVKRRPPPPAAKTSAPAKAAAQSPSAPAKAKAAAPATPAAASDAVPAPAPKPKAPPAKKAEKAKSDDAYRPPAGTQTE